MTLVTTQETQQLMTAPSTLTSASDAEQTMAGGEKLAFIEPQLTKQGDFADLTAGWTGGSWNTPRS